MHRSIRLSLATLALLTLTAGASFAQFSTDKPTSGDTKMRPAAGTIGAPARTQVSGLRLYIDFITRLALRAMERGRV